MTNIEVPEFKFCLAEGLDDSFLPAKGKSTDTAYDVRAAADVTFDIPTGKALIPLGIRAFIPDGWWLDLRPRSSTFAKLNLHCLYGVIDEGYENGIMLAVSWQPPHIELQRYTFAFQFSNTSGIDFSKPEPLVISKGDRLGQLIPVKRQEMKVTKVSDEEFAKLCQDRNGERGTSGFGDSGKK
jgi:dUTPase